MKVVYMHNYNLSYLYDKYISAINGMIKHCIPQQEQAEKIINRVFTKLHEEYSRQDPGICKVMIITREMTFSFIQDNIGRLSLEQPADCATTDNCYIFRLVYFGQYTIAQLSNLLYMEEDVIRQKLHTGMLAYKHDFGIVSQMGV